MHAAPRSVQQQQQKEPEKQHDHAGASIPASAALDSNSSSTLSAARAPAERQQQQQQQHAPQRRSSNQNGRSRESNQQYQPQPGSQRDGTSPASSPELVRSRRSGQQYRAMQDSFRFKYIDQEQAQQQPAAGTSAGASQVVGAAGGQHQQQQHVVIGSTVAYEQPHAPNSYAVNVDNGHSAYHMAVAASQAQPQSQQQQQQITFSVGTQTVYSSYSIAQVAPPQPTRYPATYSLAELCQSREFIMNRARTLGEQGGKRLELMMMPYLLQRLDVDQLPTNEITLLQFAPNMMPVAGTRPKDFLMIWTMWVQWAKAASIPSVPLVAPLIAFFLLDSVPTLEDRARLVQILDSYRHAVNEVLSNLGGRHRHEVLPEWDQDRWTEWTEMLQTGKTSLFDWQAVREACGLGVPPAAAAGLVAPALSSSVPAPMITGPSFRPAIAAAPSSQQHSPERQRQPPQQQYQHSPPLAGPSTNPMAYYPQNSAPPTYPAAANRPGISPLATYSTSASQQSSPVHPTSHGSNAVRLPQQQQQQQQPRSMRPASFSGEATNLREMTAPIQGSRPTSARPASRGGTTHTATQDAAAAVPPRAAPPVAPKSMPPTPLVSPTSERPPMLQHTQGNTRSSPAQVARRPSPPATSDFLRSFRTLVGDNSASSKQTPSSSAAGPANGATKASPPAESQATPQRAQPAPFATGSNGSQVNVPASLAALQLKLGNGTPAAAPQQQQQSNRNASGTAPPMQQQSNRNPSGPAPPVSRRSIGSSAEAPTSSATGSEGHRAPANSLDLAATNAQTRATEAARLTAAEVRASLTPKSAAQARCLPPPAPTSADTTNAHSMSIDGASTAPHVIATAAGSAVQNGSTGVADSAATILGKRKRPSVSATVENWKRLAEEAPKTLPPQAASTVSIAAPASSRAAAAAPQQHPAPTASNLGNAQSSFLPSPIQQALSSLQPFAADAQAASSPSAPPPSSAPPPPSAPQPSSAPQPLQAQAVPGRVVNVQRQVPPPPPRSQLVSLQQHQQQQQQQQSNATMPPKKRARGRPKKTTAAAPQQQLVTMDATDEEFDKAIAAARGAIQAFEAARSAFAEGWRANPATSGAPLPPIARSRVRAPADVVSASPWRDGKKQVFGSTANPPSTLDVPYGEYVPKFPQMKPRALPAPARTQAITHLSDPLFTARPFPNTTANGGLPPVELHFTRKPCPATGRTTDLFAITPHPFYPYPSALSRLDKAAVDKALEHINRLADSSAQRVDLDQAASKTAGGDKSDDRQRVQAIKATLARHVRGAVQGSRPLDLPEDLRSRKAPKLAKRTWKEVKKVYPGPTTVAASTSSAAATASEGAATTAAAKSAQPPVEAASSPPKQVSSSSVAQPSRDEIASLPSQPSKPSPNGEDGVSSPVTAPPSVTAPTFRPDTPLSVSAPLAEGSASTPPQAPVDAGGLSKPARPSLAAVGSPSSAPVVPGVRPRAKSIQGMRRVSSGPGVHPLAQLYATAPNTIRQQLREMSVAVPGVPSDPVAEALAAAAKKMQPRRRSVSMTASPRLPSSNKELAHPSPPLVPIPLVPTSASEESSATDANTKDQDKGKARRLSVDPPHPKSGSSALGVTLDADAETAAADSNSTDPAGAMQIDFAEDGNRDEAADASVEVADSQPDEEDQREADADHASSASSSVFASAVSSVARAAGGALASAARAFMPGSGGGTAPSPVPGSPAANKPADADADADANEPKSTKGDGAGAPQGGKSDKNAASTVPASKSTTALASSGGKSRPKSTAHDGTRVRLPTLHMPTEPLHPCALRDLAVKKRWMQASEPFRPFGGPRP